MLPRGPHGHSNAKYNAPDRRTARRLAAADPLRQCRAARYYGANATRKMTDPRLFWRNAPRLYQIQTSHLHAFPASRRAGGEVRGKQERWRQDQNGYDAG